MNTTVAASVRFSDERSLKAGAREVSNGLIRRLGAERQVHVGTHPFVGVGGGEIDFLSDPMLRGVGRQHTDIQVDGLVIVKAPVDLVRGFVDRLELGGRGDRAARSGSRLLQDIFKYIFRPESVVYIRN
jgi:hypothetical protein